MASQGETEMVRMEDLSEGHSGVALTGNNGDPTIEFKGVTVVPTTTAEEKSRKGRRKQNQDQLKKDLDLDVHTIPLKELCERLEVDVSKGLSKGEAELRLQRDGPNSITPPRKTPEIIKFLKQMVGWFSLLLWSGSILSAVGYILDSSDQSNLYLAIVLAAVVTLTGIFSYIQERKSSNVMEKFKDFLPALSKVKRESLIQTVPVAQLVCGDIVFVKAGDKVPADLRVFSCNDCHVDNSSLTGEAEPQPRTENCTSHNPLETENLLFYGTLITAGEAYGIVVLTGDETVIGRIARLATGTASQQTTLQRELNRFIIIISVVAIVLGVVFLAVSFIIDRDIIKNLVFMIGIIVANVPEGLLATVTVALTLTAKRMASKKVLVKTLSTVESLGSTSVICSDKTGTLTQNKMSCVHIWLDNAVYTCETSTTCATFDKYKPSFICLQRVATLCCNATFNPDDYGVVPLNDCRTIGDSSESALIKLCDPITPILAYRHNYLTKFEIPFNSDNKYHVTIHSLDEEADKRSGFLMLMKGAPERVAARCSFIIQEGKEVEFSAELKSSCEAVSQHFASLGERVLGFAQKYLSIEKYPSVESLKDLNVEQESSELVDLSFIGLISLIDPPREGVPEAVAMCKAAGIKVIMVTGDHPITAKAIAHQVGIITGQTAEDIAMKNHTSISEVDPKDVEAVVVQGQEIKSFTRDDWDKVLSYPEIVFARTSPQQKLVIVENNQIRGQVVAVTGDGVNDSPALKKANIGVAMGISGSDVSKEAAHMILLDDNFTSIVNGVQEGRRIFDNLKKSIAYTLSSNIPEIIPFILFATLRIPLALTTVLILCIDLGTDMLPAISLAYPFHIMHIPPRSPTKDRLVNFRLISFSYFQIGVIQALSGLFTYFYVLNDYGFPPSSLYGIAGDWADKTLEINDMDYEYRQNALGHAQTAYFVSIVVTQVADLLICKTRRSSLFQLGMKNWLLVIAILEELVLACCILYIPGVNTVLGTKPIKATYWALSLPFALLIFLYDEGRKFLIRRAREWKIGKLVEWSTYW